eukprot:9498968-Pyramimonas_sp.AAC.1
MGGVWSLCRLPSAHGVGRRPMGFGGARAPKVGGGAITLTSTSSSVSWALHVAMMRKAQLAFF